MTTLIIISISALIYILFNECEDESIKSNWKKHKQFLNTNISWKNKWKLDGAGQLIPQTKKWYYFGFTPKYKERFYLSSTVFVAFTDGEHLFQLLKNISIYTGFAVIGWQYLLAWFIGKSIGQLIKEKINWLQ